MGLRNVKLRYLRRCQRGEALQGGPHSSPKSVSPSALVAYAVY